jgi:hypothetical protein
MQEQQFYDYITGLAPAGETALLVRQKPVMRDGAPLAHLDGSPKYTWPAYLPTKARKDGEAWYLNTGSFMAARFLDGKPSASAANCDYVLAMMLDDIGTKSKIPPLPPTWIMETSEGSFQWGYGFSDQPSKGEFSAAITAIAAAGYTDPGAINPVRNFRIPGSVNLKPGRAAFRARLVEFHPDREYTLPQICEALEVTPAEADTARNLAFKLRDTGMDTVLEWLNDKGLVLSHTNAEGWMGIVCPNHAMHSDGQIGARYKPLDRSFCCYHGHCDGFNTQAFLSWVHDNGGPRVSLGLRDELLAQHMQAAMSKLSPTETFPDEAAKVIAEVERKEVGRVDKAQWYERFAYVVEDDAYFDMDARTELSRGSFNAIFRHVNCKSIHISGKNARRIEASVCYDENRAAANARLLRGITYAAGDGVLVARDGDVYGNRWRDARPSLDGVAGGDVSRWVDHCKALVPVEAELNHCFDVMAFKLQNPRVKINHAVLHGGDEGSGKDTMWAPFIWSVCGPGLKNRGLVDNDGLTSQWGYALESEILILNELKEPEANQRRALANKLKPIIAAPPETLPINRKGLHPYDMVNRMMVLAFTNDPVPISISSQDRRWFCIWSAAGRMDASAAQDMWRWYRSGGFETIARWLADRDVSKFNPSAAPMWTEFKENLIESGMSIAESYILHQIRSKTVEFSRGVVAAPLFKLCESLSQQAPGGVKIPQAALLHALKEAGWVDMGRISSIENPNKRHVYASPELARTQTKSYLRNLLEAASASESGKVIDFPGRTA